MKKQLFYFLIFTSVMIGCKKENLTYPITTKSALWETQLDSAMLLGNKSLAKYGIQMINYNLLGVIQNNADVINVKQRLLSNGSYCPYYSNNGTISIKPVETIKQLKTNGVFYNFVSAKIFLDTIIKVGQRKVNIQWEYNGQKLNSLCVVSEEGIVYDDIITNLFILNDKSNTIPQIPVGLNTKLNTLAIDYGPFISKTLTFSQAFDAYWLWGSQRGHAEVNLIVTGDGSRYYVSDTPCYIWSIVSSFTTATSYMSLGTYDAIIRQTIFTPGDRGQVSAIYALYLASPLVSIQITDQWSYFSLSFGSSNVGSELHASGAFNVTPGDFM